MCTFDSLCAFITRIAYCHPNQIASNNFSPLPQGQGRSGRFFHDSGVLFSSVYPRPDEVEGVRPLRPIWSTPPRPLWRHCTELGQNVLMIFQILVIVVDLPERGSIDLERLVREFSGGNLQSLSNRHSFAETGQHFVVVSDLGRRTLREHLRELSGTLKIRFNQILQTGLPFSGTAIRLIAVYNHENGSRRGLCGGVCRTSVYADVGLPRLFLQKAH